jgi:hypothetical protein
MHTFYTSYSLSPRARKVIAATKLYVAKHTLATVSDSKFNPDQLLKLLNPTK